MIREVKVGAFVFSGIVVTAVLIFVIGDNRRLFDRKADFEAVFDDVKGVKPGSPVVMGGVDIGRVSSVRYLDDLGDNQVHVTLRLVQDEAKRIRKDSVAEIVPKGLLGDQMVEITVGTSSEPLIEPGQVIPTREATELLASLNELGAKAQGVMANLEKTSSTLADEGFRSDLREALRAMKEVLVSLNQGQGYVPRLLHDKAEANRLSTVVDSLGRSSKLLEQALAGANQAIAQVNTGPGLANELLYGTASKDVAANFSHAAAELTSILAAMREGDGLAKSLIYGDPESKTLINDLNAVGADLREVTSALRAGKGTLGALLVDPSVYEDLKMLLGNVERNQTLRALVRYSIKQDEKQRPVEVVDPGQATGAARAAATAGNQTAGDQTAGNQEPTHP